MTRAYVDSFPADITVPVVLAVATASGNEYNPVRYIVASSPQGERLATMQFNWYWDDVADIPVKFRVFVQHVPLRVDTPGTYTLGLYDDPDGTTDDLCFLPVVRNPFVDVPEPDTGLPGSAAT